ncbi:hypothetical protein FACS1894200_11750 [Spirochaetia bacterium]|nr:hypothetical protein FACS1894200_11750 [Spirochaetia bacterium]
MREVQISVKLPEMSELSDFDLKMYLGAKLYEEGRLSSGYCADIAGLSKRAFLELLGKFGAPMFEQTDEEIRSDVENADKLFR